MKMKIITGKIILATTFMLALVFALGPIAAANVVGVHTAPAALEIVEATPNWAPPEVYPGGGGPSWPRCILCATWLNEIAIVIPVYIPGVGLVFFVTQSWYCPNQC